MAAGAIISGNIKGIAAAESANSSVVGANLIPLLTLGILGSVSAALIVSACMIHGLQPGPLLFENQGRLVYGFFGAMLMANFVNLWVGQIGLRLWVRVMAAPQSIIFSAALLMCITGVGMASGGVFGVMLMLGFAVLGYLLIAFGYPVVIVIIAFFLGPRLEVSVAQSLALTNGDPTRLAGHPVAVALLILSVAALVYLSRRGRHAADHGSGQQAG